MLDPEHSVVTFTAMKFITKRISQFHIQAIARQYADIRLQRFLPVRPSWQH